MGRARRRRSPPGQPRPAGGPRCCCDGPALDPGHRGTPRYHTPHRHAVHLVSALPYNHVLIASDCLSVVNKIQSMAKDRSQVAVIIHDIKQATKRSISFSFIHVSRSCNEVAHSLARSADHLSESVWFHEAPELIRTSLYNVRLIE